MIDIVRFQGSMFNLGFSKIYTFKDFKIFETADEDKIIKTASNFNVDIITGVENYKKKDKLNARSSGLNQVICKEASENKIAIGFDFNLALNSDNKQKIIGRMMQNVKLCRKYKVRMALFSGAKNKFEMRSAKDLIAFGKVIGMTGSEVKKALNFEKKKRDVEVY
ncbi:MAG TPA: RNase P subunit p30 family protein [Candidatus Nanoarchaeia archaeon]|nr:RNase P subunit p30 family protein [Candidatus Nanoarchaeia archaeon]